MLPDGFTEQNINELAVLAAAGDDDAMAELIGVISPIAGAKAYRLSNSEYRVSTEDLTQEGMLGFLEAVKHYDISKGVSFKTYANKCIENRIISAVKTMSNSKNMALSSAVTLSEDLPLHLVDPAGQIDDKEAVLAIKRAVDETFSDFEKDVYHLRLEGDSYRLISMKLACSEKSVDNAIQRIKKKLADFIG